MEDKIKKPASFMFGDTETCQFHVSELPHSAFSKVP